MLKKFFATMLLAVTLAFVGAQTNTAEAREVYVGRYSDGTAVYVLTETIHRMSGERAYLEHYCRVRAGRDYLDYTFWDDGNNPSYSNSEGYRGRIYDGYSPVAAAIYNYIKNY